MPPIALNAVNGNGVGGNHLDADLIQDDMFQAPDPGAAVWNVDVVKYGELMRSLGLAAGRARWGRSWIILLNAVSLQWNAITAGWVSPRHFSDEAAQAAEVRQCYTHPVVNMTFQ